MPSKIFILLLLFLLHASCLLRDNGSLPELLILRELGKKVVGVVTGTDNVNNPPTSTPPTTNTPTTTAPSAPTISNLRDKGVTYSGFLIGTATQGELALSSVEVSLDNGSYSQATGTTSWKFQLPTGSSTWRDNTKHTISVRSKDVNGNVSAVTTIFARKGQNKDINGDGYSDVVVGAKGVNAGGGADQGRVYIFYSGGKDGVANTDLSLGGIPGTILTGSIGGSDFGYSVSTGDVNGDGYADVAVGARGLGKAYIFHSQGNFGIANIGAASANTTLTGVSTDNLGQSIALGDINGDGFADIAIGELKTGSNQGAAYIFHSQGTNGVANTVVASANATLTGGVAGDYFGVALTVVDLNGDGYSDVSVGAYAVNSHQGAAYVFHSQGISGVASVGVASANTTLTGSMATERTGSSIASADINGDGYLDLIVGAPGYNSNQGRVYVFFSQGISGIVSVSTSSANSTLTGTTNSQFGNSLSLGDINGDGFADILTGSPGYNAGQGGVFVFFSLGASGLAASLEVSSADITFTGIPGTLFGWSVITSDVNGDGYSDISVGAFANNPGRAYIFHLQGISGVLTVNATSANTMLTGGANIDGFANAL